MMVLLPANLLLKAPWVILTIHKMRTIYVSVHLNNMLLTTPPSHSNRTTTTKSRFLYRGTLYANLRIFALKVSVYSQIWTYWERFELWVVAMEKMFFHSHLTLHRNQFGSSRSSSKYSTKKRISSLASTNLPLRLSFANSLALWCWAILSLSFPICKWEK